MSLYPSAKWNSSKETSNLTELGLSMMFKSKMQQHYWVEAFYTTNFLRNLLFSSTFTNNRSPYEALFGNKHDYSTLRVFGCSCYPTLRSYSKTKFDPRSLQCVFLGYNDKYKGHKCIYPPTEKVYISKHVLFEETRFPFLDVYIQYQSTNATPLYSAWQQSFLPLPESSTTETSADIIPTRQSIKLISTELVGSPTATIVNPSSSHSSSSESSQVNTDPHSGSSSNSLFTYDDFPLLQADTTPVTDEANSVPTLATN